MDQGNRKYSISQAGKNADKRLPSLVSLLLLIMITTALTTIHSESLLHSTSTSSMLSSSSSNAIQSDSPLAPKNSMVMNQLKAATLKKPVEQYFVSSHNNANGHVVMIGEGNQQQQQQPTKINSLSKHPLHQDGGQGFDSTSAQIAAENEANPEANFANLDQQLETNFSPVEQMAQQVGGPSEVVETENSKDDSQSGQLKGQMIERRFGLFKKNHQNDNLPFSNPGTNPYFNDCERCLSIASPGSQGSTWLLEQPFRQPLIHPLVSHNMPQLTHHFNPLKSKLSKFHFSKPLGMGDSYYGQNYHMNSRYRIPMSNRIPYRTQPFECIQPSLLGNSGPIVGDRSSLSNQASVEDSKLPQQISYSNSQY